MLQRLQIKNYAIIDALEVEFQRGLNIITGETGAGKSILMGALGLVLGNRADSGVLFEPSEKCVVEAYFITAANRPLQQLLRELDLEEEENLLLRREIAPSGKSRSFVNDTPVTLQDLKRVASLLVDLHRQFDTQSLGDDGFQFGVLDALAGHAQTLESYRAAFENWRKNGNELRRLQEQQDAAAKEMDYTRFLFQELEEMNLQPDEMELLENEVKLLSHAGALKSTLAQAAFVLDESDPSLVQQVKQLANSLQQWGAQLPELTALYDRLLSVHIELQDIAQELSRVNDRLSLDPQRLAEAEERLGAGYKLLKKHHAVTTTDLIRLRDTLSEKLQAFENIDEQVARVQKEEKAAFAAAAALAQELSRGRMAVLAAFGDTTNTYLQQMGMPNARMKATCGPPEQKGEKEALHPLGADAVAFLFDANKTGRFEPIEKVASGGELSRLMLAIKAQVAQSVHLPALIFDEIDTGISGEAARQVGILMKKLAAGHQVISITHQPQIAARAGAHFFVYKSEVEGSIKTRMRILNAQERVDAIARMLSGEAITEAAMATAREMMEQL